MATMGLAGALTAKPAHAAGDTAADRFVQCLNGSGVGDLMILVDTSASLQSTDTEAARVRAAEFLLKRLAKRSSGVELNVALAGFANRYEPTAQFVQLNEKSVDGVIKDMKRFADRNDGEGTDYWLGLDGARRELAQRKQATPTACQGIVFFSDGTLDIDRAPDEDSKPIDRPYDPDNPLANDQDRRRAADRAAESMCRDGGLADQLRVAPITVFGIGLTGQASGDDFDLMRRVSAGECGAQSANGQFDTADDIDGLLRAFDNISGKGLEATGNYCTEQNLTDVKCEAHSFVMDPSVTSVSILGDGDLDNYQVLVIGPSGKETKLEPRDVGQEQQAESEGVGLTYEWYSTKSFSLDLDKNAADKAWTGEWQIIFLDPENRDPNAKSRTNLKVTGNLVPTWKNAEETVRADETDVPLEFGLMDAAGDEVDPASLLGKAEFTAVLVDAQGNETPVAKLSGADIAKPQKLDTTDLPTGRSAMRLTLTITTAAWKNPAGDEIPGTELLPQSVDKSFQVAPAAGFPTLGERVSFGAVEGEAENVPGTLTVTGPGCVWLDQSKQPTLVTTPEEVAQVTITSQHNTPDTCLEVPEGEQAELPVEFSSVAGNGAVNGTFAVLSASAEDPSLTEPADIDFNAELTRPLNAANFALTLIAALLLGPGIPIGLLYLAKWATAKIPGRGLIVTPVAVTLDHGEIMRDGAPIEWRDGDFRNMAPMDAKGQRRLDLGPIKLEARTGASPFGAGYVVVDAPGRIGASSEFGEPFGKEQRARLQLGVHNTWVMVRSAQPGPDQTMVVFLTAADAGTGVRDKLLADLQRRGPQVYERLASAQNNAPDAGRSGGPGGPGDGSPFGPGGPNVPGGPSAPGGPNGQGQPPSPFQQGHSGPPQGPPGPSGPPAAPPNPFG